jgi:hypothetical protein
VITWLLPVDHLSRNPNRSELCFLLSPVTPCPLSFLPVANQLTFEAPNPGLTPPLPLTYPRCTTPISHRGDTPHRRARQQVRCRHFQQTGERHLLVSHFILPSFLRRVLLNQISFYPSLPFPSRCRVCRAGCGHNDQGQEINRGKKDTAAKCLRYVRRVRQIHVRNKKITPS